MQKETMQVKAYGGLLFILCVWMQPGNLVRAQDCQLASFRASQLYDPNFDTTGMKESYPPGSQFRVPCSVGSVGYFMLLCMLNGWEHQGSKCAPKSCGHPGDAAFAEFQLVKGDDFVFGSEVEYTCKPGFQMVSRSYIRHCDVSGWDSFLPVCEACSSYLGIKSDLRLVSNDQMTASSVKMSLIGAEWHPYFGRLDEGGARNAWSAATNDQHQWLQVDLGCSKNITGIVTQGDRGVAFGKSYVKSFKVSYSDDGGPGTVVTDANGFEKIFDGNIDSSEHKTNVFDPPVSGRYVRVLPWTWENRIALRMELLGCEPEQRMCVPPPETQR